MGSTFKVFTLATALDTGAATLRTSFDASQPLRLGSRAIHDDHAENRVMTLKDVFIHSSNIGTAKLALAMGRDPLVRYFDAFGLFKPAEVELAESTHPIVPAQLERQHRRLRVLRPGDLGHPAAARRRHGRDPQRRDLRAADAAAG